MTIMKIWAVLFAFVGVQMGWNLRPFVGDRGKPFKVFRHYEGNFYTAIIYSLKKLAAAEGKEKQSEPGASVRAPRNLLDTRLPVPPDSSRMPR